MINKILYALIIFMVSAQAYAETHPWTPLLVRLDSVLEQSELFVANKEKKIADLRKKLAMPLKAEERLWFNKMMYEEYFVYNADSAMSYVNQNLDIATHLGEEGKVQEWLLNKVFLYTAQGLLSEAEKQLQCVDTAMLGENQMFRYYDTHIYLYTHQAQYIGTRPEQITAYYKREMELRFEALPYLDPKHPEYYSFMASIHRDYPRSSYGDSLKWELVKIVDRSELTSRNDAMNAYRLAVMFKNEGNELNYVKYLTYSAIADIRSCNRDIASLEELATVLYDQKDIDRGYTYINFCLKSALLYPNRVRVLNISVVTDKLQQAYRLRNTQQESKLRTSLYTVSFLSAVLLMAIGLIYLQFRKLARSRHWLNESNRLLNRHVVELSEAQQMLAHVNEELNLANEKLQASNNQLIESNYVKEEYIGYVFSICSNYITKLDDYRKNISRKLKTGQMDDIRALASSPLMVQSELKEFYHSFDAIFLHIYPDFVDDFNALLRPEEQVVLKEGELLNTELRIYALVRLGINDSVKIAEFLHCSPQTVYNNRLKTRNKAVIPKEEFTERVHLLGKMQK